MFILLYKREEGGAEMTKLTTLHYYTIELVVVDGTLVLLLRLVLNY